MSGTVGVLCVCLFGLGDSFGVGVPFRSGVGGLGRYPMGWFGDIVGWAVVMGLDGEVLREKRMGCIWGGV